MPLLINLSVSQALTEITNYQLLLLYGKNLYFVYECSSSCNKCLILALVRKIDSSYGVASVWTRNSVISIKLLIAVTNVSILS